MIRIHTSQADIKDTLEEYHWNQEDLEAVRQRAAEIDKSELFLFWLTEMSRRSEEDFNHWLHDLDQFSKQDLIDIIHEMGPEAGSRFLKKS